MPGRALRGDQRRGDRLGGLEEEALDQRAATLDQQRPLVREGARSAIVRVSPRRTSSPA